MVMMKESDTSARPVFLDAHASKIVELLSKALRIEEQMLNRELRGVIREQNFQDIAAVPCECSPCLKMPKNIIL